MRYDDYVDYFGKFLFLTGIVALVMMILSPLSNTIFTVDEYFTLGLIKFPLMQGITITSADVHPPFYYVLLKAFIKLLSPLGLSLIQISKFVTLIPYVILLGVSATKIKREYGWLTAGLFVFASYSMSELFLYDLAIRMYSWAGLFLVLSFIYLKDVLVRSDLRSWFLFTLFTLLGAYTHYYCAISSLCLYLILLIYFIFDKLSLKENLKKWIASVVVLVIGYAPWGFTLISQLVKVHEKYWIPQVDFNTFIQCISYYCTISQDAYKVALAVVLLIFIVAVCIISIKRNEESVDNKYALMGILVLFSTLLFGLIASFTFKPILISRYLLPASMVFWLAASILISKVKDTRIFLALLALILIMGAFGVADAMASAQSSYDSAVNDQNFLSDIDNSNSTVICLGRGEVMSMGTLFDKADVFTDTSDVFGLDEKDIEKHVGIKYTDDLNKTLDENKDKDIYILVGDWRDNHFVDDFELARNIDGYEFYRYN